jgi:hypothetical protein
MSSLAEGSAVTVFLVFIAGCLLVSMLTSPDLREGGDDFFARLGTMTGSRPSRSDMADRSRR